MGDWMWRSMEWGFLPRGYPASVTHGYMPYVGWTCVGLLSGRIQSVLATQAALFTVGLGSGAIPMAAAVQWILKDGVGHAGSIMYAAAVNTQFDADAKRYRLHATVALTVADVIAVLMPLVPQHFFLMASMSSTTSSIANLTNVAARARVMSAFARQDNLADCVRAGQTQGKLMSLLGTTAGAALSWSIGSDPYHVLGAMVPLAAISTYAMHASSQLVVLRSLNVQRAERAFAPLVASLILGDGGSAWQQQSVVVKSPEQVASEETIVWSYQTVLPGKMLLQPLFSAQGVRQLSAVRPAAAGLDSALGPLLQASLKTDAAQGAAVQCLAAPSRHGEGHWDVSWHEVYALAVACSGRGRSESVVALWHADDAGPEDKARGVLHACMVRHMLSMPNHGDNSLVIGQSARLLREAWPRVREACATAGWDFRTVHLDGDGGYLRREQHGDVHSPKEG